MNFENLCFAVAGLTTEQQTEFFNRLDGVLTEQEKTALYIGVAYFRMLSNDNLKAAIKTAVAEQLYKEFTRGEK